MGPRFGVQLPLPPGLLRRTPVRWPHALNLQSLSFTLISHILPFHNGADQIKPCQHLSMTGCLVLCGEQGQCALTATSRRTAAPDLPRVCVWGGCPLPFSWMTAGYSLSESGSIMGEGLVGSTRTNQWLLSPQAFEPTELKQKDKWDETPVSSV